MVLLTLKNLQQQTFTIEIDITASVKELKEKIEKDKGQDYPAVGQKLIYAGKILQDDYKLETYIADVNKFLVIMVTKPPKPEVTAPSSSASTEESSSNITETVSEEVAAAAASTSESTSTTSTSTTSTAPQSTSTTATAESMLVMGDEFSSMVQNIMEMGYERPEVERALRASFNNPYTAVQYLVDGIPEGAGSAADEDRVAAPAEGGAEVVPAAPTGEPAAGEDPLAFLQNQPQFRQMTQMMRTNPQLLDAFLQQIRTTNPALLQAIQENQEAFVRMLNQGENAAERSGGEAANAPAAPAAGGQAAPEGGRATTTIMLTPQDREAIDRLLLLGNFPEELVVQAFFAFEKNENLVADFLFSQAD